MGPLMKSDGKRVVSLVPGDWLWLKAVWHTVQAIPTRYGGSTLLASSRYLSMDHFFASKFLFLKSCRPTTPLEKPNTSGSQVSAPSFIRSILRPYLSGFSAATLSGSLISPIFSHRSERGTVFSIRRRSTRAVSTFSFLLVSLA